MSAASDHFPHVLIIGGGLAGVAVLLRLIRDARQPLRITVAEPREILGQGVAYSTDEAEHLLNGTAKVFSIYDDDPEHFVRWLRAQAWVGGWSPEAGCALGDSLPPRKLYGAYLRSTLAEALANAGDAIVFTHARQRVVVLEALSRNAGYLASFSDGGSSRADQAVLATGVFARRSLPFEAAADVRASPRYVADIWSGRPWDSVSKDETIAFLGSGLTALDALIAAEKAGFRGRYLAFSRRGLAVQPRREVQPWPEFLRYELDNVQLRPLLRQISRQRRLAREQGEDWQRLVPAIKPHVAGLWSAASRREKQRFLQRLRVYWDTALHRSAPQSLAWQERAEQQGRYRSVRGQVRALSLDAEGRIVIAYREPGKQEETVTVDRVVNCLGFEFDWKKIDDPLIRQLLADGLALPESLGFGIQADRRDLTVLDVHGARQPGLYTIGHPLRGTFWESNAIPEQTPQAGLIARTILDSFDPVARARRLVPVLSRRAEESDRENAISLENIEDARAAGLAALAVPRRLGGLDQNLEQAVAVIGELGRGDPSTALIVLMQTFHQRWLLASPNWPVALRDAVLRAGVERGDLINALRVEPELGSPVRGGLPATVARRVPQGWLINGRKIYSTGAQVLRWGLVWAVTDEQTPRVGEFLVPMQTPGVRIETTWDHLGLRGSGSHDVVLENVLVPEDHGADLRHPDAWSSTGDELGAWLPLMLAGLYDGVARNARDWLVAWSARRRPSNLSGALSDLPRFRAGLGEIDALLLSNASLLTQAARTSDDPNAGVRAGLVKYTVTSQAIAVVNQVLTLTGNHGLTRDNPVERYLRDVLCGRVHHPQNDLVLDKAGRLAFAA